MCIFNNLNLFSIQKYQNSTRFSRVRYDWSIHVNHAWYENDETWLADCAIWMYLNFLSADCVLILCKFKDLIVVIQCKKYLRDHTLLSRWKLKPYLKVAEVFFCLSSSFCKQLTLCQNIMVL